MTLIFLSFYTSLSWTTSEILIDLSLNHPNDRPNVLIFDFWEWIFGDYLYLFIETVGVVQIIFLTIFGTKFVVKCAEKNLKIG